MKFLFCLLLLAITNFAVAQQTSPQSNDEKKMLKEQQAPIKRSSKPATQQVTPQPTPTKSSEADNRAKQLAGLEKKGMNVQAYNYLGLDPLTATPQEYSAAKEKLYHEQPQKYTEFKKLLEKNNSATSSTVTIRNIKRSDYNAMPADRKAAIDAQPERYQIID